MKRKKYSPEFKREAIELVRRSRGELSTGGPGDWCCTQPAHTLGAGDATRRGLSWNGKPAGWGACPPQARSWPE